MTAPTRDTVTAADGTPLARRRWPAPTDPARGRVLLVHGLGEHSGRYGHVATWLRDRGWQVTAYDHRGHGDSGGRRGRIGQARDLLDDLARLVDAERADGAGPLVLFGHSLGGLVAAHFVAEAIRPVEGLVLSSPALDAGLNVLQRVQLAIALAIAPDLAVGNGLDPALLSHDPDVVRAYREDPLVHDRVTGRLVGTVVRGGATVLAAAARWTVPTLLLWAGADGIVAPAGSAVFAATAPPTVVTAQRFDGLFHEILNERQTLAEPVYQALARWLDERFPR